ncbi:hypothetical protein, partial [Stenotrophomonas sp. P5_B8]
LGVADAMQCVVAACNSDSADGCSAPRISFQDHEEPASGRHYRIDHSVIGRQPAAGPAALNTPAAK